MASPALPGQPALRESDSQTGRSQDDEHIVLAGRRNVIIYVGGDTSDKTRRGCFVTFGGSGVWPDMLHGILQPADARDGDVGQRRWFE